MFPDQSQRDDLADPEIREDVSRADIVAAFRAAMVGHFRSHIPGTNINESTLLATDYLNHFHELVMMLEAVPADGHEFAQDMLAWRPITYEEHFSESGFRDKTLAIAAYRRAPPKIRARFDDAVARLHGLAVTLISEVAAELNGRSTRRLRELCVEAAQRLRILIDEANAIANGETRQSPSEAAVASHGGGQAAIDALFDRQTSAFGRGAGG
jgi:hypothetical protein